MFKFFLISFVFISVSANIAGAQTINLKIGLENLPQPITDIYNTFNKIQVRAEDNTFLNIISEKVRTISANPQGLVSDASNWWGRVNNWFSSHVGVTLKELVQGVANLFVWVFEWVVKLIKLGIGQL